jgi:hypothetical protein
MDQNTLNINSVNNEKKINVETLLEMKTIVKLCNEYLEHIQNGSIELQRKMTYMQENSELWNEFIGTVVSNLPVLKENTGFIIEKINKELHIHCQHNMENDYIDIFPEKSMLIQYCTKCYSTF